MKIASNKKWITVTAAVLMLCVCAFASAQSYSLGDEADEVATIQTALKQLKLYDGEITGHFGAKTESAVEAFQKRWGLKVDGIAGEDTVAELYFAADITVDSSSNSSTSSTTSSGPLRHGSRSEAVRQLQEDLKNLGYYSGSISGHYGTLTEAAVTKFQKANGISADGVAGNKTLDKISAALNKSSSSSNSSSSSVTSSSSSSSSSSLRYGVKSEAVRELQENLKSLGYYSGSITGNFGNLTKEAVYNFQRANDLSADGVAGSKTLAKIASRMNGGSSSSSSSSSTSSSSSNTSSSSSSGSMKLNASVTLMEGNENEEVRKLQKILKELNYYTGNITGNFGAKTKEAVVAFQKSKGLTADGVAGKRTINAINAAYDRSVNGNSSSVTSVSSVLYENFYNWRRNYDNGEYCTVYDYNTGYTWTLRIMSKDAHMDAEPATAEDTEIMNKAFAGKVTWTAKPVWVTFSDGKTYLGSTHNVPHTPYHLRDNNFDGHLCVHFPIPMEKAQEIGPYATSHQECINEAWAKMVR